jgi:choice-of-anchor B domain-containing protein
MAGGGSASPPAPQASADKSQSPVAGQSPSAGQTAQPTVPKQFTSVAAADWTSETPLVGGEVKCQNGKARIFPCQDINLLSFIPARAIGDSGKWGVTDLWGWTDPATGRDFVLAGREAGTSFIEITDPLNPRYLGSLPIPQGARPSRWRDIKVYKNHAFIVSDNAGPHGMQVFDLTQLRDVKAAPAMFRETAHYDRINSAHNIAIDTASGFAYTVGNGGGGETCGGGLHMVDIRNPVAPTFAGCFAETLGGSRQGGYIHDTQCGVYHGPDQQYQGRQICLNAATKGLGIVDVTDKQQPKALGVGNYPNVSYAHQGWLTDDHRYFFLGDETDEGKGHNTRTMIFDLKDLGDPVLAKEFFGTTEATDHNLYIRGRYVYQSNYRAGLRVLDISDPVNPKEVAHFDTAPTDDNPSGFGGSWSNYPYFKDGVIAMSTYRIEAGKGVYIVQHRPTTR